MLDEEAIAYSGLDIEQVAHDCKDTILNELSNADQVRALPESQQNDLLIAHIVRTIKTYIYAKRGSNPQLPEYIGQHCVKPIPTWADPKDDITLQNMQARIRLPTPWTIANKEGKMALVTSNASEAVLGYTTAGGDMHMGGANPIGGEHKPDITQSLKYFETEGLAGLPPVQSLYLVNQNKPSAELRPQIEGEASQTDEGDLKFSYAQEEIIARLLLENRGTPREVHAAMKTCPEFPEDSVTCRDILIELANVRWPNAQFKRVCGTLAPHVGSNVDPHQAIRTTVLGDHFRTGLAQLTLDVMAEKLGGSERFERAFNMTLEDAKYRASIGTVFKGMLLQHSITDLLSQEKRSEVKSAANEGAAIEAYVDLTPPQSKTWQKG